MKRKQLTLCLIHDEGEDRVLLGMKKRGFGEGKWNGFGGKVNPDETIEDAAKREMLEECGISVHALERRGVLDFSFEADPEEILEVHIFRVTDHSGDPAESEEMRPEWYAVRDIPFDSMWPDDRHWIPLFLAGKNFTGRFHFGGEDDHILEQSLEEVEELFSNS